MQCGPFVYQLVPTPILADRGSRMLDFAKAKSADSALPACQYAAIV